MTMGKSCATLVAAVLVAAMPASAQNIVIDGSFENPVASGPFLQTFTEGSSMGAWTVGPPGAGPGPGDVELIKDTLWAPAHGNQSVDLSGIRAGSIHQDLTTSLGQQYSLGFALAGNPFPGPAVKTLEVYWGLFKVDTLLFDVTGKSTGNMGWGYHNYTVIGTGTDRLRFVSLTPGDAGPALDDVSVSESVVPEPISLALFMPGLAWWGC